MPVITKSNCRRMMKQRLSDKRGKRRGMVPLPPVVQSRCKKLLSKNKWTRTLTRRSLRHSNRKIPTRSAKLRLK